MGLVYIRQILGEFLFTVLGIFLIGSLPYLFFSMDANIEVLKMVNSGELSSTEYINDEIGLHYMAYFNHVLDTASMVFTFSNFEYFAGIYWPLFPDFFEAIKLSMIYLVSALIIALIVSITLSTLIMTTKRKHRNLFKGMIFVIETLPDLFIILVLQIGVIWFYKKTGLVLFNITSSYGEPAIALPILCLSILPIVYMMKYLLLSFEDEERKQYVEFAKGKGVSQIRILFTHMFRNALFTFMNHFKTIFWFTLSNLLMLEIIFNIRGMSNFIWQNGALNPEILTITLLILFIPFFIIFTVMKYFLVKWDYEQGVF